jgi:anaerobic magnesium-protoporphyrin IX monomethyl ester cyclase
MSYFQNICLIEAPHVSKAPHAQASSDLTQLCYLAGAVHEQAETVFIPLDYFSRNPVDDLKTHLKCHATDLVGISTMSGAFNNALRLARVAKSRGTYVVLGGYHPSALPTQVLESPYVDAVVIGEGELTFRDLVANGPSRDVKGLAYKDNGRIIINDPRPLIDDLDDMPRPLRRLRPRRFGEAGDDYSIDTVYTSRGCPWHCTYCANHTVNKRWRARNPENVVEELMVLHRKGRRKLVKMWDANLLTDVGRVEKIFDLMVKQRLTNFYIWTEARVDDVIRAEAIIPKLYAAGLREVSLGIESPSADILRSLRKGIAIGMSHRAVQILRRSGIRVQGYFVIGHQSETEEDTKKYPEYAVSLGLNYAIFMVMTPYPATQVYDEYERERRIRSYHWDHYNNFTPVVETKEMDLKTLKRVYAYCYGRFHAKYPPLAREGYAGMVAYLIGRLYLLQIAAGMNTANTSEDIKDFIYDATLVTAGKDLEGTVPKKTPLLVKWFGFLTLRVRRSPGRNVDFTIRPLGRTRRVSICETSDTDPVKGPLLDLEEIAALGKRVPLERMSAHIYKGGVLELSPRPSMRNLRLLTSDPVLIVDALSLIGFGLRKIAQGLGAIVLHRFRSQ